MVTLFAEALVMGLLLWIFWPRKKVIRVMKRRLAGHDVVVASTWIGFTHKRCWTGEGETWFDLKTNGRANDDWSRWLVRQVKAWEAREKTIQRHTQIVKPPPPPSAAA